MKFSRLKTFVKSPNFLLVHSVEKREILSHQKNISQNQLFSNFSSKTVDFTKFLSKLFEREFLQFPHTLCSSVWKNTIKRYQHFFCQINIFTKELTKELISRKFLITIAFLVLCGKTKKSLVTEKNFVKSTV